MPYGLSQLRKRDDSLQFTSSLGKWRRESQSLEENAAFLVRWAEEIFANWATWMKKMIPKCRPSYKSSTLRIVKKIQQMHEQRKIESLGEGWSKIPDMLRA